MGTVATIQRRFKDGDFVMVDVKQTCTFMQKGWRDEENHRRLARLELQFGQVIGACATLQKNDFEYTIRVEKGCTECFEEEYLAHIFVPDMPFVHHGSREVAVWVEHHGDRKFAADLLRRGEDQLFEVRFVADGTVLKDVPMDHLSEPDEHTLRGASPGTLAPDPLWLLDRKIQANIDVRWPMHLRVREVLKRLRKPRPANQAPLCGPFTGKDLFDSEGFPAHPAPLPELAVGPTFVDTWGKFAGKVKFATTYKIGPSYPRNDAWVDRIDAGEPLYFHAALPVHAGLVCLGTFPPVNGQPEWVRASDVALVGVAIYAQGDLCASFADPPLEPKGLQKFGHEACHFIPGCAATFKADCAWVGAVFCLAPSENDFEIRDDIYTIHAYHKILADWARRPHDRGGYGTRQLRLEVNLVLSTNYLANLRQVCSGSVRVNLTPNGLAVAEERLRHVQQVRIDSKEAMNPMRGRKVLSQSDTYPGLDSEGFPAPMPSQPLRPPVELEAAARPSISRMGSEGQRTSSGRGGPARPPPPSGPRVGPFGGTGLPFGGSTGSMR